MLNEQIFLTFKLVFLTVKTRVLGLTSLNENLEALAHESLFMFTPLSNGKPLKTINHRYRLIILYSILTLVYKECENFEHSKLLVELLIFKF